MTYKQSVGFLVLTLALGLVGTVEAQTGAQKKVTVGAATRLDWTFVVSNKSMAKVPAKWLPADYDSTQQTYDLYVPEKYNPKQTYPVIIFVSAGAAPAGFSNFEPICKEKGVIFASPYNAGNNVDPKQRVRIVLDVLDDVRRKYRTDPDRTYISGFSGGGRIACGIALALPEYFGGAIPICASEGMRDESWVRQRVVDRLSIALVTGESDFNRGEVERWRGLFLKEVGVNVKVWVMPKMGHAVPSGQQLQEVYAWLEEGVKQRQELAKKYPASRIPADKPLSREDWAKALVAEGKERLQAKETLFGGLMQLKGAMERWDDAPSAAEAKKLLIAVQDGKDKTWELEDIAEQRRYIIAHARSLTAYATGPIPQQYLKDRPDMAKQAIQLWMLIQQDGQDAKAVKEGEKYIPELKKLMEKE